MQLHLHITLHSMAAVANWLKRLDYTAHPASLKPSFALREARGRSVDYVSLHSQPTSAKLSLAA